MDLCNQGLAPPISNTAIEFQVLLPCSGSDGCVCLYILRPEGAQRTENNNCTAFFLRQAAY